MNPTVPERRQRVLSDEDIEEICRTLKRMDSDHCFFDDETRSLLKTLSKVYNDARSAFMKGVIALLIIGGLLVAAFGAGVIKPE